MVNNIPEILYSRKSLHLALILLIILLSVISFILGRLSMQTNDDTSILSCASITPLAPQNNSNPDSLTPSGTLVASKNGTVYHFPWCSGAQRINEENKIWFTSQEEAQAAGYRPAANCKGL